MSVVALSIWLLVILLKISFLNKLYKLPIDLELAGQFFFVSYTCCPLTLTNQACLAGTRAKFLYVRASYRISIIGGYQ